MEFEDLNEKFEWESQRVAAAFGVGDRERITQWITVLWFKWTIVENSNAAQFLGTMSRSPHLEVEWRVSAEGQVTDIRVGDGGSIDCVVKRRDEFWYKRTPVSPQIFDA
ncbi:MAG: hypothetical protein EOO38_14895 [Cytophagaceae bacterium]|nr:MAG: hypothetical protein EOO38_14895 [Cytophagaceae bacterium]